MARSVVDRVAEKVALNDAGCLVWIAYIEDSGYARVWLDGRLILSHRWSYEHHIGPIPDGLVIDHLCRNRACLNPEHLEPVTNQENVLRGAGPSRQAARALAATHCPSGHPWDDSNTYFYPSGKRACRTCVRALRKAHHLRHERAASSQALEDAWLLTNPEIDITHSGINRAEDKAA